LFEISQPSRLTRNLETEIRSLGIRHSLTFPQPKTDKRVESPGYRFMPYDWETHSDTFYSKYVKSHRRMGPRDSAPLMWRTGMRGEMVVRDREVGESNFKTHIPTLVPLPISSYVVALCRSSVFPKLREALNSKNISVHCRHGASLVFHQSCQSTAPLGLGRTESGICVFRKPADTR